MPRPYQTPRPSGDGLNARPTKRSSDLPAGPAKHAAKRPNPARRKGPPAPGPWALSAGGKR